MLRVNAREDKIVGTPSLISLLYQEPGKIEVYILLKWEDVVSFFPGLHTLAHIKYPQDIYKHALTTQS